MDGNLDRRIDKKKGKKESETKSITLRRSFVKEKQIKRTKGAQRLPSPNVTSLLGRVQLIGCRPPVKRFPNGHLQTPLLPFNPSKSGKE